MNQPLPSQLDQAAFQQVWRRVMPEDRPDCPFTLEAPALPSPPPASPSMEPAPLPVSSRSAPPAQVIPCLGESSAGELPGVEEFLAQMAAGHQVYRAMARRGRAGRGNLFSALASAKAAGARQLSTAYFLISGRAPASPGGQMPELPSLPLAVRARFHAEQALAARLDAAANTTADPCLAKLYRTLAGEAWAHSDQLRGWLEGM